MCFKLYKIDNNHGKNGNHIPDKSTKYKYNKIREVIQIDAVNQLQFG